MPNSMRHWLTVSLLTLSASALLTTSAGAQQYPNRPVTIIAPFAPGSQPELTARLIAKKLEARLGQPFVVENRAGAGGNLGAAHVAQSPGDGYKLLWTSLSLAVFNPLIYKKMPYKEDELAMVSATYHAPVVLGVPGKSAVKSFSDLAEMLRKSPRDYTYGTAGVGTLGHICGAMLQKMIDAPGIVHLPYRGTAAVIPDMLAGRLSFGFDAPGSYKPYLESGDIRGLFVTSERRLKSFPDVPTVAEIGLPEFRARTWFGWRVRSDTPRDIINTLAAALIEINKDPELLSSLALGEAEPFANSTPEHAEAFLASERKMWEPYIRASGASID